jgi:hypothetical protein
MDKPEALWYNIATSIARLDWVVLRLILCPLGRMSETVRGAIPSPAIAQRRRLLRGTEMPRANCLFFVKELQKGGELGLSKGPPGHQAHKQRFSQRTTLARRV